MASIKSESNGRKTIQVVCPDGKRRSIRLGKCTVPQAEKVKRCIEDLAVAVKTSSKPEPETTLWLAATTAIIRQRVINAGLHRDARPKVQAPTMLEFTTKFIEARKTVKPSTKVKFEQVKDCLLRHFGDDKRIDAITEADSEAWAEWLATEANIREGKPRKDKAGKTRKGRLDLARSTVSRRVGIARQFFNWAIKAQLITENPFKELKCGSQSNSSRQFFVSQEVAKKLIDAAPNAKWRAIIALSRYAGLRTPSETVRIRWEDIDFPNLRLRIHASKTEHHKGGGIRYCPIFPVLLPYLEDLWKSVKDRQPKPTDAVIDGSWDGTVNLLTAFLRILKKAGVVPWPKLFHNMRASRQTELLDQFPIKDVCAWIGNTQAIAMEAYAMQRDSSFQQAISLHERDSESDAVGTPNASESDAVDQGKPEQSEAENVEKGWENDDFQVKNQSNKWAVENSNLRPQRCQRCALTN